MWKGPQEFFTYTRKERKGIYTLLALTALLWSILLIDDHFYPPGEQDFTAFHKQVEEWKRKDSLLQRRRNNFTPVVFDPNTAGDSVFRSLNLSKRQISTIFSYRSKGGRFYSASDLENIYGLDSSWVEKVKPFVRIHKRTSTAKPFRKQPEEYAFHTFDPNTVKARELQDMGLYPWQAERIINYREKVGKFRKAGELHKIYGLDSALIESIMNYIYVDTTKVRGEDSEVKILIDINTADSLDLLKIEGVGPVFASRIISYRERLGGYYSKRQLREVYGINEERYRSISSQVKADSTDVKKMNINSADFQELLAHPYFEYKVVKNIVYFRERRRPYRSLDELKNIELVDEVLFSKIAKYLKL